ncbi:hypothetical protein PG_1021 [Porphyromonas gingivalis W83]|uniref:Uncharacterized protein n=1 Tax=Porphyromonas gingivalis (strain ATCC BAA-308 / W83) TaxID=242619 RepID=Q7MVN0_PORGI|nr:hypothetical protein PG_1021 [Porphyromonas gingivalis W83]
MHTNLPVLPFGGRQDDLIRQLERSIEHLRLDRQVHSSQKAKEESDRKAAVSYNGFHRVNVVSIPK